MQSHCCFGHVTPQAMYIWLKYEYTKNTHGRELTQKEFATTIKTLLFKMHSKQ